MASFLMLPVRLIDFEKFNTLTGLFSGPGWAINPCVCVWGRVCVSRQYTTFLRGYLTCRFILTSRRSSLKVKLWVIVHCHGRKLLLKRSVRPRVRNFLLWLQLALLTVATDGVVISMTYRLKTVVSDDELKVWKTTSTFLTNQHSH